MTNTELIRELRALTQAGMKDCKEALEEAAWDLQKAADIVKVKGLNIVSGREGKAAAEGMVTVSDGGPRASAAMVEVNCQTDFVANNSEFIHFVNTTADTIAKDVSEGRTFTTNDVEAARQTLVATTKENIVVRRWWVEEALDPKARVFTYVHSNNKIGVLLTLLASSEQMANDSAFKDLGNDLVMQIAAMNPVAISVDRLDPVTLDRQKSIFETQLTELKKPQAAWPKILEGKFNKWYGDVCLLNQESVLIPKTTIQQVIKNVGAKLEGEIQVVNFVRCQVGEGLDFEKTNFAEEVSKLVVI